MDKWRSLETVKRRLSSRANFICVTARDQ
ncbi:hypothetical protein CCACVL1_17361 [Corchorus capsularis]|uniref:Uncharacterized protein n=1 Tax=Corchorus capsularis TaxID=210143 RepID=A0A1R3HSB8_COCAP|nr:hypothetical protein CCACVL1_17361 [Corchorus capsularis]